jgi:hypothetical protein
MEEWNAEPINATEKIEKSSMVMEPVMSALQDM